MSPPLRHRFRSAVMLVAVTTASCSRVTEQPAAAASPYLFVWAGPHTDHAAPHDSSHATASDFIAVLDVDPASATYGRIISTTAVDGAGAMAHHTEYSLSTTRTLFANDYMKGRVALFDLSDPRAPRLTTTLDTVPGYRRPHTFARLPNGHVIVTLQFGNGLVEGDPGGIGELDASGQLLRVASSADPAFPGARIRTYGLEVLPTIDRAITTSSPMDDEVAADVIQLWRLSDLKLLRTIPVPKVEGDSLHRYPFEIRALPDGRSAMMHSYYCGFYLLSDLETDAPRIELVHAMRNPTRIGCSVPTLVGRYAVVPIAFGHRIVALDLTNPAKPVEVSALETDTTTFPHWSSADAHSDRIVVTEQGSGVPRVFIVRLDSASGRLSWDERFKDADSTTHGVSFNRASWPHGGVGKMMPHGAVFGRAADTP